MTGKALKMDEKEFEEKCELNIELMKKNKKYENKTNIKSINEDEDDINSDDDSF